MFSNSYELNFTKWFKSRLPLLGLLCGVLGVIFAIRGTSVFKGADSTSALVAALTQQGFELKADQLIWMSAESGWFRSRPVLFIARKAGEPEDLYYGEARVVGTKMVFSVSRLTNVSRTSSAMEGPIVKNGRFIAYGIWLGNSYDAVAILDTKGEPADLTARWPFYARVQNCITNLQESGRCEGFGIKRYRLSPQAKQLQIEKHGNYFAIHADEDRIVVNPALDRLPENVRRLEVEPMVKGQPGTITWVVDTVRNISWVGPVAVEWLEHAVFGVTDKAKRIYYGIVGENTADEVKEALNLPSVPAEEVRTLSEAKLDIGWPPAALITILDDHVKGEGEWVPVVDADFVNANPSAPPAFYQTFIRVDPERRFARVYVTLWDPRQVQLQIVSGTLEPKSATGETGSGIISRDSETLRTVVAAFNGGFQALHGEFGMMAERQVYLPPKPWAATVAVFDDGRVGMGSWPGPQKTGWSEQIANSQIPPNMVSMRQNLTSVVEDGEYNPWKRWYWGAAPIWAKEQTYIHRSGICLTKENFFAYFWGGSMGPEELGKAMLSVRCIRGVMLDMNDKHTGFEFYRSYASGDALRPLGRELSDKEFEGSVDNTPGFVFRARLAVNSMTPIRFPRYLYRDPRDFFYLTLKPIVPGKEITIAGKSVTFSTEGLPHALWPYPFARAAVNDGRGRRIWLVRIDPKRAPFMQLADDKEGGPLAYISGVARPSYAPDSGTIEPNSPDQPRPRNTEVAFFAVRRSVGWNYAVGTPGESARVLFWSNLLSDQSTAMAALGVDKDGFWVYAERDQEAFDAVSRPTLREYLARAGVEQAVELPTKARLIFFNDGQTYSVAGERGVRVDNINNLALIDEKRPVTEVLFPEVKPVPYKNWGWMQNQRVRYFPTGPPRFRFPTPDSVK